MASAFMFISIMVIAAIAIAIDRSHEKKTRGFKEHQELAIEATNVIKDIQRELDIARRDVVRLEASIAILESNNNALREKGLTEKKDQMLKVVRLEASIARLESNNNALRKKCLTAKKDQRLKLTWKDIFK